MGLSQGDSNDKYQHKKLDPPKVLALGFGTIILIGALLLNLSIATKTGEKVGFINALFTASSAVCVTGLVVVNTASTWSTFGHVVIISLIQIGGLGFMTMATIFAIIAGKKITLKERLVIKEQLNQETYTGLVKLTKYVVAITFLIEGVGALLLSTRFIPIYGLAKGIWFSVFHSISAFCNAGFDLIGSSIEPFVGDVVINLTIAFLIIIGGLGFSVYIDITKNKKFSRYKLHTKVVLVMTIALLILGTVLIYALEYTNPETFLNLNQKEKALASFFQSAISRTAGFNSVPLAGLRETTVVIMIILMFIGGSPGSTAGGLKTTTFGVIMATTISVIKGEEDVVMFKKRIDPDVVKKSFALFNIGILLVITVTTILCYTEGSGFLDILFEVTSAFATVGVTRGLTPNFTNIGKIILSLMMFGGRLGPLTMLFALSRKEKKKHYKYSKGNITVG